jgi:hypothetical protein
MMNNEDKFYRDLIKKFFDNGFLSAVTIAKCGNKNDSATKFRILHGNILH